MFKLKFLKKKICVTTLNTLTIILVIYLCALWFFSFHKELTKLLNKRCLNVHYNGNNLVEKKSCIVKIPFKVSTTRTLKWIFCL